MPGKVQNPDSWFRGQRLATGLTVTALARQIGAPLQTVSRWEHGGNRPPWRWILKLADIFRVRSEELVERLRGERVGDPCPQLHDCDGRKILPDDPLVLQTVTPCLRRYIPGSLRLLIKVSCAGCRREHAYTQSGPHPKFCPSCCVRGTKAKPEKYKCVGYPRYGKTPAYGPSCPREVDLLPGEVHERLKYNKIKKRQAWFRYRRLEDGKTKSATTSRNYTKVNWARSFIDEPSHTYRCKSCAFASHRFEVQKARLEEIEGDKLRSESEHSRLWKAYYPELTPNFNWQAGLAARKKLLGEKGGKERLYGERHRAGTSRGKTLLVWDIPRKTVAVSLCLGCDELAFNPGSHPLEYHRPCYRERKTSLLRKRGPRTKNENLQKYISWAIGYCVSRSSLREIAAPDDDPTFALNRIKFIFRHFPVPVDKVQRRFRKFVSLLHTAAVKRGLFADDPTPEKLSDPHGKILAKNMSL